MIGDNLKALIPFHMFQIAAAKILNDPFRVLLQPHNSTSVHGELLRLTSSTAKAEIQEFFLKSTIHYPDNVNRGVFTQIATSQTLL